MKRVLIISLCCILFCGVVFAKFKYVMGGKWISIQEKGGETVAGYCRKTGTFAGDKERAVVLLIEEVERLNDLVSLRGGELDLMRIRVLRYCSAKVAGKILCCDEKNKIKK